MHNLTQSATQFYQNSESLSTSTEEPDDHFEIDVQPKRKFFDTIQEKRQYIEEYTKKKKTELCKNFQLQGWCKYGNDCSFAHGENELQPKTHLHQKYKTKPCNRYFSEGFCPYGIRCQYIHEELKDLQKFDKYLNDSYKRQLVKPPVSSKFLNHEERFDVQRFQIVLKNQIKKGFNPESHTRSSFFIKLEKSNN